MKKMIGWTKIGLVTAVVFCLAGCGTPEKDNANNQSKQPEEYIVAAQKALEEADSFHAIMQIRANMEDVEDGIVADVTLYRKPLSMAVTMNAKNQGDAETLDQMYVASENEDVYLYRNYVDSQNGESQWTKKQLNTETEQNTIQIYDVQENILSLLKNGADWTVEEEKTGGVSKSVTLTGNIPVNKVYDITEKSQFFQFVGMSGLHTNYYADAEAIPIRIQMDERSGKINSCEIDMTQTLQSVMNRVMKELDAQSQGIAVQEYQVIMEMDQQGGVAAVEIPEEAHNAINYDSM